MCRDESRALLLGCGATDFAGAGVVHMTGGTEFLFFDMCLSCVFFSLQVVLDGNHPKRESYSNKMNNEEGM